MKRVIFSLLLVMVCSIAMADNSARIKELQDINATLTTQMQQAQEYLQRTQISVIGNNAVIVELQKQDLPKEEKE